MHFKLPPKNKIFSIPNIIRLTLCILYICLMFKNEYARVIAWVLLFKEFSMLIMQMIIQKKCGMTFDDAKWYSKICTASLFLAWGAYVIFPNMIGILANIIMVTTVCIIVYTMIMYAFLFRSMMKHTDINSKYQKNRSDKRNHQAVRAFIDTLLILVLYLAFGATLPFIHHPKVSTTYDNSFQLSDYVSSDPREKTADTELATGSERVRLVTTNDEALTERIRLIDMARDSIAMSTFDFKDDNSGSDIIAALCNAADRGVDVKVVVDGFSGLLQMDGKYAFYELASRPTVELKIYNPVNILEPWNLMGRMHDKYLIVDDYGYLLGGRNVYDLFLGSYNTKYKNLDLEVFVWNEGKSNSSSIYQVKSYFESIWSLPYCKPYHYPAGFGKCRKSDAVASILNERLITLRSNQSDKINVADSLDNTLPTGKIQLISNPIHRNNKEPYVWNTIYKLMDSAQERVYLHTPYIICSKDMYEDLTTIGHKNIESKLLLNAPEIGANPFGCTDYLSEKLNVLATGFSIYEYMGSYSYHAKAVLIDQNLSLVGSYNTDMRSTYLDTELMLSIESEEFNAALGQVMNEAESKSKHTISLNEYTVPATVSDVKLDLVSRIKNIVIIFLTRPFRFLL